MHNDVELAREAVACGASAFVLKNAPSSELLKAIRGALKGISYLAPEIREALDAGFIRDPKAVNRPQHLTERQREVLQMLGEGHTLRVIANQLNISYRTARLHKFKIREELGISRDSELIKYALKHGIVSPL